MENQKGRGVGTLKYRSAVALGMISLMVVLVWRSTGIFFEINDDKCITEILCGRLTGVPDAHTVYVNYLLSLPLSLLYRAVPTVPWFGITLILFQVFAYWAVLESVYSRCEKIVELAAAAAAVVFVMLADLYLLGCIQFTSTGALAAAAGYFCLLTNSHRKKGWIFFYLLQFMAGLLRVNAMLMMQPIGILAVGGALIADRKRDWRERFSVMGKVFLAPTAVFLTLLAVNILVYRGSGWKDYLNYCEVEAVLFDYGRGVPPYPEVREILDRYQVSEEEYYAYACYMMPDWMLPPDCAMEVAAYVKEARKPWTVGEWWAELKLNMIEDSHWGIGHVLAALWMAVAATAVSGRKASLLMPALGLFGGKLFTWGYLIFKGRFPLRISMPLLAGEVLLLLALFLRGWKYVRMRFRESGTEGERSAVSAVKRCGHYCLWAFLLFLLCLTGIRTGYCQYAYVLNENRYQTILMKGLREITAYCDAHPENRYLLDMLSTAYYKGSALESEIYQERNYIISGTWFSNSPDLRRYNAAYLSEGRGFYFLIYDDGKGTSHPCVAYLIQKTGVQPKLCERISVSHGGSYLVYFFDGILDINVS